MSQRGLQKAIHARAEGDTALSTLFGGTVRIYPGRAPRDTQFPYLCHLVKGRHEGILGQGSWTCDVWDHGHNSAKAWEIAERLKVLFANNVDKENVGLLHYVTTEEIATDDDAIHRVQVLFDAWWADRGLNQSLSSQ